MTRTYKSYNVLIKRYADPGRRRATLRLRIPLDRRAVREDLRNAYAGCYFQCKHSALAWLLLGDHAARGARRCAVCGNDM